MSSIAPDEPAWYKCRHCSDQFKREDHLRRHELSHGFPRFLCDHDGCGMRFHRKDVLQRHKLVHQPNPLKRRRKPRRGPLPHGPIQQQSIDSVSTGSGSQGSPPQEPLPELSPHSVHQPAPPLHTSIAAPAAQHATASAAQHATASQSPQDHPMAVGPFFSGGGESFNLTSEWDYGIQEWPEYAMHVGGFQVPSWQEYAIPAFDPTTGPQIPPSLALAHAPNASFPFNTSMFHTPMLPMTAHEMRVCADKFRQRFLPRIPFLHYLTCEQECATQNSTLYFTMAMAGSLYLDEYRSKAARMHKLALETMQRQAQSGNITLQILQAKILLIDFAVWYGDEDARRWANREKHTLSHALLEYMQATLPPLTYDDWGRWRLREEIKRTGFAFFVNSVIQTSFYGHDTPILANTIELALPCPESVWEATTEADWLTQLELLELREKSEIIFPTAAHAILSQDTVYSTDYELATIFGQLILLCVIMDSFNVATKLPTNYTTVEGWKTRDMSTFRLRESIDGALSLWTELWWASPECLWDTTVPAHPRIENIFLHQYIMVKLHKNDNMARGRPDWTYKPIEAAVSVFTSISKAGFTEVAQYASHVLSLSVYYIAVEMARTMGSWLGMIASPTYGPLSRRDNEIITRIRQAVRRHVNPPSATAVKQEGILGVAPAAPPRTLRDASSLEDLARQVEGIWTLGLGGEQWKGDEVHGVPVGPKDQKTLQVANVDSPMSIP